MAKKIDMRLKDLLPTARWQSPWWRRFLARHFGSAVEAVEMNWVAGVEKRVRAYRLRGVDYVVEARTEPMTHPARRSNRDAEPYRHRNREFTRWS